MSDQNAFVNSYIENCMAMLQERSQEILMTKTNLKLANDTIAERDGRINAMAGEMQQVMTVNGELQKTIEDLNRKIESIPALIEQIKNMKGDINIRDGHIIKLDARIKEYEEKISALEKEAKPKKSPKKKAEPKLLVDHEIIPIEVNLESSNQSTEANDF